MGFTLIELLVVIAIIAILATVVIINVSNATAKARYAKTLEAMSTLGRAAMTYEADTGRTLCDTNGGNPADAWDGTGYPCADFRNYLPIWPEPVCDGWKYDWDNWTLAGHPGTPTGTMAYEFYIRNAIRVTLRHSNGDSLYFYCFQFQPEVGFPSDQYCYAGDQSKILESSAGGQDVLNLTDKKITCKE